MKKYTQQFTKMFLMLTFTALFVTSSAFSSVTVTEDKTTLKAREAVANASPDDWKTLAINAEKCMKKSVNLKEAAAWLDKSLEIKKDAYNLRVKGDYYKANNLPDEALEYYIKSIQAGLADDINYRDVDTQLKISALHKSRI